MKQIQDIFSKVQETKRKQRELNRAYRDSLNNTQQYVDILEKMEELKQKKKIIVENLKKEFPQLDRLKADIESDNLMLSDLTINCMIKGEPIEIVDEYNNKYQPILNVKFKKI
ncbi:MAG: hypothetical protein WCX71_03600 [Candidatus Buchananbacteria bacterium]